MSTLFVQEPVGLPRERESLLAGVPLARGRLRQGGWFLLHPQAGPAIPAYGSPAAWWPDGSVKWLHLHGRVSLPAGGRAAFTLGEPLAEPPQQQLAVTTTPTGLAIADGDFVVELGQSPVLAVRHAGQSRLAAPGLSVTLTLAAPDGTRTAPLPWRITAPPMLVEETPTRVVARLATTFTYGDRTVGELILFAEVCQGSPRLGLQAVFIYLGDPDRDLVAELALHVHTDLSGPAQRYAFGTPRGLGQHELVQPVPDGPRWPHARQLQLGSSFYRLDKRTASDCCWVKTAEGQRAPGWCHLASPAAGVTLALRHFWQEYPRALAVDADAGTLTCGLVPAAAEPLDLRRYSPTRWGKVMYEHGEGPFPAQTHGATGIAKAAEILVHFHTAADAAPAPVGFSFAHPLRALPAPELLADTAVLGHLAPAPVPGAEPREQQLADLAEFLVGERERRAWYGLMNYGDVMLAYYSDGDRWAADDGGYAWLNTESLPDLGLWLAALRHGRHDWLDAACAMTRHNRDVDTYHRGNFTGSGTRHNVNHWGCSDKEWRLTMPLVRRLHFYLTGDPWTREVIRTTIGIFRSYDRTAATAPSMSSALTALLVAHELSGDPADLAALTRLGEAFAQAILPDGHVANQLHANLATGDGAPVLDGKTMDGRYFFLHTFGAQHTLVELADLLPLPALQEAIVRHARRCLADNARPREQHPPHVGSALVFLAAAYRYTGDDAFRAALAAHLAQPLPVTLGEIGGDALLDPPRHPALLHATRRNKLTCTIGNLLHLTPYALAVRPGSAPICP